MKTPLIAISAFLLGMFAAVPPGCSLTNQNKEEDFDSAIIGRDNSPAKVLDMPDGFRNVAYKCNGTNMVYVTSRGKNGGAFKSEVSAVSVVPNDPRCSNPTPITPSPSSSPSVRPS